MSNVSILSSCRSLRHRGAALACLAAALFLTEFSRAAEVPNGFFRAPTLHGDTIVFVSESDLWRVPVAGGVAQRLTSHPGTESHPAISPDGTTLAFSAEYEGPTEVYTMPLDGGLPTRRTFDGANSTVAGWTPEGRVLVRSTVHSTLPDDQLSTLDLTTGQRQAVPLAQASEGAYAAENGTLFFTRLPKQGSSTKRYEGGWIQNLWRFAPGDAEASPIPADFKGTRRNPMWWRGRLYFISDRDGVMNLWSCLPDGSEARQLTRRRDFDIASASLHNGRIAYQTGADLWLYDIAAGTDNLVPVRLASDFDQQRERWVKKPSDYLTAAHLSPNGDRLVLTARGQVFVAPVEQGRFIEAPRSPGVRYREAAFIPDGKSLVVLSDATRELEFWKLSADGLSEPTQLTTNGTIFRFQSVPSPDGVWLAWVDKNQRLWVHHLERRETKMVCENRTEEPGDLAWSPDSQWLAFTQSATNTYAQIHLYRLSDGTLTAVTSDRTDSRRPAWSPDGKWLYFLTDRQLRSLVPSPWGPRQPDPFFTETTRIYQLALRKDLRSPFAPKDELAPADPDKKEPASPEKKSEDTTAPTGNTPSAGNTNAPASTTATATTTNNTPTAVVIDLDGLATRLHQVPVPAGNYEALAVTSKHLFWVARDTGFDAKNNLRQLEITSKDPKPKTLVEDLRSYELSADRKKLLIRKGDDFYVIASDASAPAKLEDKVKLDAWSFSIQPREEWRQIFTEAWRMLRDFFYDRGMHQVDWPGVLQKYLPLVDRVSDRSELNAIIAEMAGELSALHIFVRFGDERDGPDQIPTASLGARLVRDPAASGWRVEHVYQADPDYPDDLSPLAKPGIEVRDGDILRSINGRSTLDLPHPNLLLRRQAGQQVRIEVKSPTADASHPVIVTPITAEQEAELRYDEWEFTRRQRVDELGKGAIGYVHLRAMGGGNIAEWARDFYPVFQRQGLIIDVRHNRGGNIDSWILSKLLRKAWFYWQPRVGDPTWNMQYAFRGHVVVLCNEKTASDGEAFTEGFRRLGLGKVIGTRTWGGEIWLSAQRWLVDSGMASAAEIGVYGPEGAWLIEGHGVDPDIIVDNPPHATFKGGDAQLEAAVKHLQNLIAQDPRPVPPTPKYPDKAFRPR
ncbi:MAG: PD40 domain-containing protein [Verrucomicrobiales bacterium]|nr:PD40 domain-containing protein [Verrucomicrobiales bacterium]